MQIISKINYDTTIFKLVITSYKLSLLVNKLTRGSRSQSCLVGFSG